MSGVQLERTHRVGSSFRGRDGEPPRPRTIVAGFCWYSDHQQAFINSPKLKNANIYLNEDLCEGSVQEQKELQKARAEGKIAYFSCTNLVVKERREHTGPVSASIDSSPEAASFTPAPVPAAGVSAPSSYASVTLGEEKSYLLGNFVIYYEI